MPYAHRGSVRLLGRYEMGVNLESLHAFRANSWFSKPLEASIHIMVSGQFPRYLTLYDALSSSGPDDIRKYYQSIIDILLYSNYSVSNRDALWRAIIEPESTYERISNAKSYAAYLVETYKTIRGFTSKSVSKGIWGRFIKQYVLDRINSTRKLLKYKKASTSVRLLRWMIKIFATCLFIIPLKMIQVLAPCYHV